MVEDVALARHLASRGWSVAFLDATGLLSVRGYESIAATWRGWGRSIGLPVVEPAWRRLVDVAVLALALPAPITRIAVRRHDLLDIVLLAVRLGTLVGTRRAYDRADAAYWLSPLADGPAVVATAISAARGRQEWRGRRVAT
jgi:dolichol-phosphate mannosyltransferase